MRTTTVLAALAGALAAPASAQKAPSRADSVLIKLEMASWDAWKARDGKFFDRFLSEDHVELGSSGPGNKKEVVAFVGSPVCKVASYTAGSFSVTHLTATTAILTYYATQETLCNGRRVPSPAWVSSLYVLRNGKWLNAFYQQTPADPPRKK